MNRSKIGVLALAGITLAGVAGMSACNSTSAINFLKSMTLSTFTENGNSFLKLTTTFDMGNVSLAAMSVNIVDPHTKLVEGTVEFTELATGQSQIALSANENLIPNGDVSLGTMLPNGKPLPAVLGAQTGAVLGIKILDHSTLYLGGDIAHTAYVGIALGIKGFDSVMNQLSTSINVFFMGSFDNNTLLGVGGIYGSTVADESGVAIFGKYTRPVATAAGKMMRASTQQDLVNDYAIEKLNNSNMRKLSKYFYGKKRTLSVY